MNSQAKSASKMGSSKPPARMRLDSGQLSRRQLRFGWWTLLVFLTFGMVLEGLHGFKVGAYLDVSNSTRRLMWTLAHAHGTLLSLVNIAFGASLSMTPAWNARMRDLASSCLMAATVLIPGGFFLGGAFFYSGDPGLGIILLPLGAVLLFVGVLLTARGTNAATIQPPQSSPSGDNKSAEKK